MKFMHEMLGQKERRRNRNMVVQLKTLFTEMHVKKFTVTTECVNDLLPFGGAKTKHRMLSPDSEKCLPCSSWMGSSFH